MGTLIVNQYFNKPSIVTDGLVLYLDAGNPASYPGTGTTWIDLSGNNYNATLNGTVTYDSNNEGSLAFAGETSSYASIPASNIITTAATLDIWLKADRTTHQSVNYPFSCGNPGVSFSVWVGNTFSDSSISLKSVGLVNDTTVSGSVANTYTESEDNVWNNIVVSYNGSQTVIHKNNLQLNMFTNDVTGNLNSFSQIIIGKRADDFWAWDGNIAIVRLYDRALSSTEVSKNFELTRTRFGI